MCIRDRIARALQTAAAGTTKAVVAGVLLFGGALTIGSSTVWLGDEAVLTMVAAVVGFGVLVLTGPGRRWAFA